MTRETTSILLYPSNGNGYSFAFGVKTRPTCNFLHDGRCLFTAEHGRLSRTDEGSGHEISFHLRFLNSCSSS